jgi:UDP-glucose 4-epimerase
MYRNLYDINFTIFRICVPYGNIFNDKFSYGTIGFFLNSAKTNKKISLYGNGSLKRTFTHVLDICEQLVQVSLLDKSSGECYNISGETFSLNEIAVLICKQLNVNLEHLDWPEIAAKLESGDTIFDSTKIKSVFPINLEYNLSQWLINNKNES